MKSLKDFSLWGFPRFLMETGNKEMKAQVQEQQIEKRTNRVSRIRIIRMPQDSN